jgi:hypothetical protein
VNNAKAVVSLCMLLVSFGLGWLLLGWWMLGIVMIGLAWHCISSNKAPPSTSHYKPPENPPSYPPPTGPTWQETVARIEAARQLEAPEVARESEPTSSPRGCQDTRPWHERVEAPGQHARPPVDNELHEHLQLLIDAGEWDAARSALQKEAYTMPDASVAERLAFADYVKDFAALDPLFKSVLSIVLPAVQAQPGIKQTAVYALVPDLDKETTRYVLYYAHVLALIERKKKGSTYQLFPFVEGVSERWEEALSKKLAAADKSEPTHKQMRAEMWARRLPQLQQSTERRPYWQFTAVGDSRDPPACKALNGRVERYDSAFWQNKAPWKCRRLECRCTVRAYTQDELTARGIAIPDEQEQP